MNKTSLLKRFVIKFILAFVILLIVDLSFEFFSFEFNLQEASSATFSLQSFLINLVIAAVLGGAAKADFFDEQSGKAER